MTKEKKRALWLVAACCFLGACAGRGQADPQRDPPDAGREGDATTPRIPLAQIFGPTRVASERPPAIAGGTLTASASSDRAYASFPEEDRLEIVDLGRGTLRGAVSFERGAEPGRVVIEDSETRAHVVLRRQGAIATIDISSPDAPVTLATRSVCAEPRGLALDAERHLLVVACASGDLVALPTAPDGAPSEIAILGPDLRDVVIDGERLLVSRFRSATIEALSRSTYEPLPPTQLPGDTVVPGVGHVVWRTISRPGGGAVAVYQSESSAMVDPSEPTAYGGPASGPLVQPMVALFDGATELAATSIGDTPLAVDVAISADGSQLAVAQAGTAPGSGCQVIVLDVQGAAGTSQPPYVAGGHCVDLERGRAVAVAFTPNGELIVQTRSPDAIHHVLGARDGTVEVVHFVRYGDGTHEDTGLDLFHSDVGARIACASCHPEGGDDGHVWHFVTGDRRTMPLRGGIAETAPFHWNGEFGSMSALLADVMGQRMGAGELSPDEEAALVSFVDTIPPLAPPRVLDADAVARGRALFGSAEVGCTTCHTGEHGSNEATIDVGTGGAFQVPSLRGLAYRAPYLHDGRAGTLFERFSQSGGGLDRHGHTTQLDAAQITDLIDYLQSL